MAGGAIFCKSIRDARNEFQKSVDDVNEQIRQRRSYPSRLDLMRTTRVIAIEDCSYDIDVSSLKRFPSKDDRYSYGKIYRGITDRYLLEKPPQPTPYPQGKRQKMSRGDIGDERNSEKR